MNIGPIHHIMSHFPMGLLFLCFYIVLARLFFDGPITRALDRVLPSVLIIGVVTGLITFALGFFIYPTEAMLLSPTGRNKILFASWSMAAWTLVAILRVKFGEAIWESNTRWYLAVLTVIAGGLLGTTGTLGGYLVGSPSGFSVLVRTLGWEIYQTFYAPTWALGIGLAAAAAIASLGLMRKG